jgi:hypothetical protein
MMFRRIALVAVAASALSLALTGCGNSNSNSNSGSGGTSGSSSSGGGGDAVAWAEKVCKSVEGDVAALSKTPDMDATDPQKAKDGMSAYLGSLATALGHMVSGATDAVSKLTDSLNQAKTTVETAKSNLDKASVTDAAALQDALSKVGEDLAKLGDLQDPTKALESNDTLKNAFETAPTCKKLDASSGGDSTSSAPTS